MSDKSDYWDSSSQSINFWIYYPNKGAPIAFAALFLISGLWHTYQTLKYKSSRVTWLYPWAASIFVAAFITRAIGAYQRDNLNILIASTVLIYAAPPVYEAANCIILGRVLYYIPYHSPLHPGRVLTTYLGIDVLVEALTGVGAPRIANYDQPYDWRNVGYILFKVSLCLFVVLIIGFLSVAIYFHRRCLQAGVLSKDVRTVLYTLYLSSFFVCVRNLFRLVSIFQSNPVKAAPETFHEPYFWIFEATPMLLNTFLLNIYPPAKYLPRDNKIYLAHDGKTELRGPGWEDKRFWLWTILDPFDIAGLVRGRDKETKFWEVGEQQAGIIPIESKTDENRGKEGV
ncbi:MAG: hypothetical protein M1834_003494 [Cirrosporium novae-zelandiae]|nr:MAG: hypothetical protein M1834_003494 [Cirrosporium novae-zelandiae]